MSQVINQEALVSTQQLRTFVKMKLQMRSISAVGNYGGAYYMERWV